MKTLSLIILILLGIFSFFLFNDKGNEYLKPYISSYLEGQLKQDMSIEVKHLKIDLNYLEIKALLNNLTEVSAHGDFSLLSQDFDLNYKLASDGFKSEQISFENKVDINGTVVGTLEDMNIQGEGETLKSHINYALNIKNDVINNIKVKINKADIASLLQLASQPAYAQGKVDIDIDIPTFAETDTKGNAKITLHKTDLNEQAFKKELKLDLPKNTTIEATLNSKVSAELFEVEGNVKSNLTWLKISNATYNVKTQKLLADYKLLTPRLSKLMFLTKQKLRGQLQVIGKLNMNPNALSINGHSKDLDGETTFNYNGKELNLAMQKVSISKLLYMLHEKPYATGKILANIQLDDLKKLRGNYSIKTVDAKTLSKTLKKDLNLDFGKNLGFTLDAKGDIASGLVHMENTLNTDLFTYRSSNMIYDLTQQKLKSAYTVNVPKLSRLTSLTGKRLRGKLDLTGNLNYNKKVNITGSTKSLGGDINFKLAEQVLSAKIDQVPVEKLMTMLSYPLIFKAPLIGDFYYDLNSRQGTLNSKLDKAQLLENQLTILVKQLRGIDLTKERYNETHFNAILNKNLIDIDFQAKSTKALFAIPSGQINKSKNTINATYNINVDNKDIGGKIQGNIAKPNVTIDSSNYLKEKVVDVIKDNIPEGALKDLGLDKIEPDAIKNLLGDLFN